MRVGRAAAKKMQEECEIRLTRADGLGSILQLAKEIGRIAQLAERHLYTVDVTGSIPVPPTSEALVQVDGSDHTLERKTSGRDQPLDIVFSPTSSAIY